MNIIAQQQRHFPMVISDESGVVLVWQSDGRFTRDLDGKQEITNAEAVKIQQTVFARKARNTMDDNASLMHSKVIGFHHHITSDQVVLKCDPRKQGNALYQMHQRILEGLKELQ